MKNQKRFGKLLITLLSTGVLLAALQSQEIITAEETTTAEQFLQQVLKQQLLLKL